MSVETQLNEWVLAHLAHLLGVAPETIALDKTLADYGLDSVDAILMAGELEQVFGAEIEPAAFLQYDNFAAMIADLAPRLSQPS